MGDAWDTTSDAVSLAIEAQAAPLMPSNAHAMRVTATRSREGKATRSLLEGRCSKHSIMECMILLTGLVNYGFFSISLRDKASFVATLYAKPADGQQHLPTTTALLESLDGRTKFGSAEMVEVSTNGTWTQLRTTISVALLGSANASGRLAYRFHSPCSVLVASAGLLPQENQAAGHSFRLDLLQKLKALQPKFLRFPGGGYIDGCWPDEIWRWKAAIGPPEGRPGHWNCWVSLASSQPLRGCIPVWLYRWLGWT